MGERRGRKGRGSSRTPGSAATIRLSPVPPFDFDLSAAIFSDGDPQIRSFSGGEFRQVLQIRDKLLLATVTGSGTVDHPLVHLRLAPPPGNGRLARDAADLIGKIFNLDLDISPFAEAVRGDPVMAALARRLRGLKPPRTPTVFEALVDSITEQQISLTAARSIERRLIRTFGDTLELKGVEYYAFPTPARLAGAPLDALRACGLSGKKAEYISGIAQMVREGALDLENHGPEEDTRAIIGGLIEVRGIGTWTAELAVLRGLSRLDAIPADDLGIRRSISGFYSRKTRIDTAEARRIAAAWGAWKGLAAYYLLVAGWHGVEAGELRDSAR